MAEKKVRAAILHTTWIELDLKHNSKNLVKAMGATIITFHCIPRVQCLSHFPKKAREKSLYDVSLAKIKALHYEVRGPRTNIRVDSVFFVN